MNIEPMTMEEIYSHALEIQRLPGSNEFSNNDTIDYS